jgi:hypothetical protein
MEQLVLLCASFDRIIKTFLFDSFLSDSFARRALWQDGLGKLIFTVFFKTRNFTYHFFHQIIGIDLLLFSLYSPDIERVISEGTELDMA